MPSNQNVFRGAPVFDRALERNDVQIGVMRFVVIRLDLSYAILRF
jgi:hypothetical protein